MKDGYVETGSGKLHYIEEGKGLPVLYVHGNTGSCRWFEKVMDVGGARAISVDLPNFGRSARAAKATDIDVYGDAIADFAKAMKLDRPVLVGHSLGGAASISAAVRNPGLFRALFLVDSAAPSGLVTPAARLPVLAAMRIDRNLLSLALRGVMPTNSDQAFFEALVDDAMLMAEPCWTGHAEALGAFDYRGRCSAFEGPVVVAWGRKDLLVNEAMARETAAAFPKAKLEIVETVGHSLIVEDPERFLGLLRDLVAAAK